MSSAAALSSGIEVSNGLEFLNSIRFYSSPPGGIFIHGLDEILAEHAHTDFVEVTPSSCLLRGDVIEVQGGPSTGKTELLIWLTITRILPSKWSVELKSTTSSRPAQVTEIGLNGRGQSVAFFDCEGTLRIERIAEIIRSNLLRRIRQHCDKTPSLYNGQPTSETAVDDAVDSALARLHVFRPDTTLSLAATLKRLPDLLRTLDASTTELGLILIDGISIYHWQDALDIERDPQAAHPLRHVVQALTTLRYELGPVIVISNWAISVSSVIPRPFYRQHLHAPWPNPFAPVQSAAGTRIEASLQREEDARHPITRSFPISTHITLFRSVVAPFASGTTIEEARGSLGQVREETVRDAGFYGLVRKPGVADGAELGRFDFGISAGGLQA